MPTNRKKKVRARREKTGESYQAALRQIRAGSDPVIGIDQGSPEGDHTGLTVMEFRDLASMSVAILDHVKLTGATSLRYTCNPYTRLLGLASPTTAFLLPLTRLKEGALVHTRPWHLLRTMPSDAPEERWNGIGAEFLKMVREGAEFVVKTPQEFQHTYMGPMKVVTETMPKGALATFSREDSDAVLYSDVDGALTMVTEGRRVTAVLAERSTNEVTRMLSTMERLGCIRAIVAVVYFDDRVESAVLGFMPCDDVLNDTQHPLVRWVVSLGTARVVSMNPHDYANLLAATRKIGAGILQREEPWGLEVTLLHPSTLVLPRRDVPLGEAWLATRGEETHTVVSVPWPRREVHTSVLGITERARALVEAGYTINAVRRDGWGDEGPWTGVFVATSKRFDVTHLNLVGSNPPEEPPVIYIPPEWLGRFMGLAFDPGTVGKRVVINARDYQHVLKHLRGHLDPCTKAALLREGFQGILSRLDITDSGWESPPVGEDESLTSSDARFLWCNRNVPVGHIAIVEPNNWKAAPSIPNESLTCFVVPATPCCERDVDQDGNCDRHPAKS